MLHGCDIMVEESAVIASGWNGSFYVKEIYY